MRESTKITKKYQFIYVLLIQLGASGVAFVFGLVAFWYFMNMKIVKEIISIIFILVNFAMLYIASKKFALLDNKPYTPLKPSLAKGVLFGAVVSVVNVIFVLLYKLLWAKYGTDAGLSGVLPMIANTAFYYWSFPYNGLMNMDSGAISAYSVVFMVVMPIAATTLGYIAGEKKFELAEKLDEFMYEKE